MPTSIDLIISIFHEEFDIIMDRFTILSVPTNQGTGFSAIETYNDNVWIEKDVDKDLNDDIISKPGVYVLWKPADELGVERVIKVGRHLVNSRMRAFQHLEVEYEDYDTRTLKTNDKTRILLFNVKDENRHWIAALEIFFELRLNPIVKASRLG